MTPEWEKLRLSREYEPSDTPEYREAALGIRFGELVQTLREDCHITQGELGKRIGSTQPAIARIEAGGVTPRFDTVSRIANALGFTAVLDFVPKADDRMST